MSYLFHFDSLSLGGRHQVHFQDVALIRKSSFNGTQLLIQLEDVSCKRLYSLLLIIKETKHRDCHTVFDLSSSFACIQRCIE